MNTVDGGDDGREFNVSGGDTVEKLTDMEIEYLNRFSRFLVEIGQLQYVDEGVRIGVGGVFRLEKRTQFESLSF